MRILTELIDKMDSALREANSYIDKAFSLREEKEYRSLANAYAKISETHISIYDNLHKEVVSLIEESKKSGTQPPIGMIEIWKYQHEKLIEEMSKIKYKNEEYKKMSY